MVVVVVPHIPAAHKGLEVRAEADAIGRVHIDHLHLFAQALVMQQRVHHHQRIAQHQAVLPIAPGVGAQHLFVNGALRVAEHIALRGIPAVAAEGLQYGLGGEPLVDEEGQGGDIEREPLGPPGPVEKGLAEVLQLAHGVLQAAHFQLPPSALKAARLFEFVGRLEGGGLLDAVQQPFAELPGVVLSVPMEGGGETGIVVVALGGLAVAEALLGADIGAQLALGPGVAVAADGFAARACRAPAPGGRFALGLLPRLFCRHSPRLFGAAQFTALRRGRRGGGRVRRGGGRFGGRG